jgi:type IV pilus assembly protein PilM
MFDLRFGNKCWPIGVDIGTDSVKMLQLQKAGEELTVRACARWKVPVAARHDPQRRDELTATAIKDMLRAENFHGSKVVTAAPCSRLGIKNVRMPHLAPNELAEAVKWEANERFTFEVSPDRLKYLRAGEIRQGADSQYEIIMLAAGQDIIDSRLAICSAAGLSVEHIDAEPVALFRSFGRLLRRQADEEVASVVIDIGEESTRVIVARGSQIVFIKNIDIAGHRFTDVVAKQLNLSFDEAAELREMIAKEHAGSARDGAQASQAGEDSPVSESVSWTIHDAERGEAEALAREISLCLRYCAVTFRGLRPKSITVTGGQAYAPSVMQLLAEQLSVECVVGQPLRGLNLSHAEFANNHGGMLAEWALCAGPAIRCINTKELMRGSDHGRNRLSA